MVAAVKKLQTVQVEMKTGANGRPTFEEQPGTEKEIDAELVLLAMGFVGPERNGLPRRARGQAHGAGDRLGGTRHGLPASGRVYRWRHAARSITHRLGDR